MRILPRETDEYHLTGYLDTGILADIGYRRWWEMHPMMMREIAKMRSAERLGEAGAGRRPSRDGRWRSAIGWTLVWAGLRLARSRESIRIEGRA